MSLLGKSACFGTTTARRRKLQRAQPESFTTAALSIRVLRFRPHPQAFRSYVRHHPAGPPYRAEGPWSTVPRSYRESRYSSLQMMSVQYGRRSLNTELNDDADDAVFQASP